MAFALNAKPSLHHALSGHVPLAVSKLRPVGALAETNRLRLALGLPLRRQAELTALLHDLYDPTGVKFHQFLKPAEFAEHFGPTEDDYAAVRAFAESRGLRVVQTHANRLLLDVEGSVTDVKKAFHVNMNVFQHPAENRTFYAPDTEPSIEADLPLVHIAGLDNYLLAKSNLRVSPHSKPDALTGSGPGGTFIGSDFRAAYVPGVTLNGTGQAVALVEFAGFASKDITSYEHMANLPNVPVTAIPIDSFSGLGSGQDEVSLDIEMAISMAPGLSQVLVYEAPYGSTSVNDDLFNQIAMDDLANQISCSWYYTIDPTTDFIFQEMAAQGQSFFNASGDFGAYYFEVFQPMGDPNITVVGGTTLTTSGTGGPWASETVWNWFTAGTGASGSSGGTSSIYGIPYWQQHVNMSSNQGSVTMRNVPDVSMTADNVFVYSGNEGISVGGTSCAAPLWAAFTALINQQAALNGRPPVGFLNPAIYALGQSPPPASRGPNPLLFHDITTGNNTNYNGSTKFYAVPGYDLCTGWGTPTGQTLINALAPPDNLTLQAKGGLTFAVANGYPLPIETQTLALKASGTNAISWTFESIPPWLSASVSHGSVPAGQDEFVTLAAAGAATNLPPGEYVTNLSLLNLTAGVKHWIPVFLEVFDPLLITPDSGLAVIGPPGGPFNATEEIFSLTNFASVPMPWTAQSTSPFLDLSSTGGTLQPGASTNVIVTLDPSASNILITAESIDVLVTDLNTSNTQILPFTLTIGNGGFETGDFSDWTLVGDAGFTNFVGDSADTLFSPYVHAGEFAALLGEPFQTSSLKQTLPTVSNQLYQISLFLNNPNGATPNQFEVVWGGTTLFNQSNIGLLEWTNMQFAVLASSPATSLEFIARNDNDYFGMDDVSVKPAAPPTFSSATISGNFIYFSWNAIPGASYQLKTSTDLSSWIKAGFPLKATNAVMTAKETLIHSDKQQFYQIILQLQ